MGKHTTYKESTQQQQMNSTTTSTTAPLRASHSKEEFAAFRSPDTVWQCKNEDNFASYRSPANVWQCQRAQRHDESLDGEWELTAGLHFRARVALEPAPENGLDLSFSHGQLWGCIPGCLLGMSEGRGRFKPTETPNEWVSVDSNVMSWSQGGGQTLVRTDEHHWHMYLKSNPLDSKNGHALGPKIRRLRWAKRDLARIELRQVQRRRSQDTNHTHLEAAQHQ